MTQEEIKKFDKKVRSVKDPLGTGFLLLYTVFQEMAEYTGKPQEEILRQYFIWKLKST
jgi:hypothetical protein